MTILKNVTPTKSFMGKLSYGSDLLDEITGICVKENIRLGRIEAFGAVQRARLGFYDQQKREYQFFTLDQPLEITKLTGNISIKENGPIVHAHITLADESGHAYGGHLASGTTVFACEILLQTFEGPLFERSYDEKTGLPLWNMEG